MSIQGVNLFSIQSLSDSHIVSTGLSSGDLFTIATRSYLAQLHETVMEAWGKFRESQTEMREQKEESERSRTLRFQQDLTTRLEAERRHSESRKPETEEVTSHASRPQRGKRNFHLGAYLDYRHLNLPA